MPVFFVNIEIIHKIRLIVTKLRNYILIDTMINLKLIVASKSEKMKNISFLSFLNYFNLMRRISGEDFSTRIIHCSKTGRKCDLFSKILECSILK